MGTRWIIAAGVGGAILEGLFWFAFFMAMAGVELNGPALVLLGFILCAVVVVVVAIAALSRTLRR